MQAIQKQGDKFASDVRKMEGLDTGNLARSGKTRTPSQVPGLVDPTSVGPGRGSPTGALGEVARTAGEAGIVGMGGALSSIVDAARKQAPPVGIDDEFDDAPPEPDDDFDREQASSLASALDQLGSVEARRDAAMSPAPSKMKEVPHGVTVDNDVFAMVEKIQNNDTTLHFLAALDFDGEPGVENVEAELAEAANGSAVDLAPPTKPVAPTAADLERADVASARAAQWVERVDAASPKAPTADPEEFEKHMAEGNVDAMTQAFLAELLDRD